MLTRGSSWAPASKQPLLPASLLPRPAHAPPICHIRLFLPPGPDLSSFSSSLLFYRPRRHQCLQFLLRYCLRRSTHRRNFRTVAIQFCSHFVIRIMLRSIIRPQPLSRLFVRSYSAAAHADPTAHSTPKPNVVRHPYYIQRTKGGAGALPVYSEIRNTKYYLQIRNIQGNISVRPYN